MDIRNNRGQLPPLLASPVQVQHPAATAVASCYWSISRFYIQPEIRFVDLWFTWDTGGSFLEPSDPPAWPNPAQIQGPA